MEKFKTYTACHVLYCIVGNFQQSKLLQICEKYDFRGENFCGLLAFALPKDATPQILWRKLSHIGTKLVSPSKVSCNTVLLLSSFWVVRLHDVKVEALPVCARDCMQKNRGIQNQVGSGDVLPQKTFDAQKSLWGHSENKLSPKSNKLKLLGEGACMTKHKVTSSDT